MRLHATCPADLAVPHFMDRVAEAQHLLADPRNNPAIVGDDRELLDTTLRTMSDAINARGVPEQLLHGEPHAGNLVRTTEGLLFVDRETCCRGPIEFDIAHATTGTWWPTPAVAEHYEGSRPVPRP